MIEKAINRHDKTHLELKLNYEFKNKKSKAEYQLDTYFFVPNNLGINKHQYGKSDFYEDSTSYTRFKTPTYSLSQIMNGEDSPFAKLKNSIDKLVANNDKSDYASYEFNIKMFVDIFSKSIRDNTNYIIESPAHEVFKLTKKQNELIRKIITEYRKLRSLISIPTLSDEIREIHSYGSEYLSLVIEKYSFFLLENFNVDDFSKYDNFKRELLTLISDEIDYRKKNNIKSIAREDSDNEEFIFRFSVLKKYFESALSIDVNIEREGKLLEQVLFSLAAGLAMLFATAVAFVSQTIYGSLTIQLFIILIISYMFKDRIKEQLRHSFKKKIFKKLFDLKKELLIEDKKIGVIRKSFDFIKKNSLPENVKALREKGLTKEFDNKFSKEKIILYRKKITLNSKAYKKLFEKYQIDAITDIFRFDVSRFLKKMDNPRKPIYILTEDGYKKISGRRVYHVNIIVHFTYEDKELLQRFMLILTRNGIKRIEPISA